MLEAERGDAAAQTSLGVMYDLGRGTAKNDREAIRWYRKAAIQGDSAAQFDLGSIYRNGDGDWVDLIQAFAWYDLAAANGTTEANIQQSLQGRDAVAEQMSPDQLARARDLAAIWRGDRSTIGLLPVAMPIDERESKPIVVVVQEGLAALGYDPGPADGVAGPKTHAAIRAFQKDRELSTTGEISEDLAALIAAEQSPRVSALEAVSLDPYSTAPGIVVSREGHILTNDSAVNGCSEIRVAPNISAEHLASDTGNDLALVKIDSTPGRIATFRTGRGIRPGDEVVVAAFSDRDTSARRVGVTEGTISSPTTAGNDPRALRIATDEQPKFAGGPILDLSSHVVGMMTSTAAIAMNGHAVSLVNGSNRRSGFFIDARTAQPFLDSQNIPYESAPSAGTLAPREVAAMARLFMVTVECWK